MNRIPCRIRWLPATLIVACLALACRPIAQPLIPTAILPTSTALSVAATHTPTREAPAPSPTATWTALPESTPTTTPIPGCVMQPPPAAATSTPLPLPTPTATPTWSSLGLGTPPPPDWTPVPGAIGPGEEGNQIADYVAGYLNLHPEDWAGLDRLLAALYDSSVQAPEGWRALRWVQKVDLDGDGIDEVIVAYSVPLAEPGAQATDFFTDAWCVLARVGGGYRLVQRGAVNWGYMMDMPRFEFVRDINHDSRLEMVLSTSNCGAHTCAQTLHVGQWDGETWHDLGQPETTYVDRIEWLDRDGDGSEEVLLHGGMIGSVGAGLHRPSTFVYAYRDGQYRLVEQQRDPGSHIYFVLLDAYEALARGEPDRALELVGGNLARPAPDLSQITYDGDYAQVTPWSYVRIMAYSGIEAMLAHGVRGDAGAMQSLLERIEREDDRENNPYVPAARCLWLTYQATGDIEQACRVMQWTVQHAGEAEGQLWPEPGYATEVIPLDRLCPLDGG